MINLYLLYGASMDILLRKHFVRVLCLEYKNWIVAVVIDLSILSEPSLK